MEKKLYYSLLTIIIVLVIALLVIAAPPNGHDSSQIDFGTTPVSGFKLSIPGNVIIGANGNGALRVRHIDGKGHTGNTANNLDTLYLQYGSGKGVHIGKKDKPAGLYVSGSVGIGKTDPGAKLDVAGDIKLGKNLFMDSKLSLHVETSNNFLQRTLN